MSNKNIKEELDERIHKIFPIFKRKMELIGVAVSPLLRDKLDIAISVGKLESVDRFIISVSVFVRNEL
jgi:hypothetical protein